MSVRTVKISNISLGASQQDIKEFFSFSGDIIYVEMKSESEGTQVAYVTFKDPQGADTAVLLSGATIVDLPVTVTPAENYQLPPEACRPNPARESAADFAVKKAEDVVSTMLAKGFVLGKDAMNKAMSLDERHHIISNASATVVSLDNRIGLSEKISIGTTIVNEKVREVDQRFQVSEITKSALAAAEQKASSASSAILSNQYVSMGASWVSGMFNKVAKAAEDVSTMTKEKVEMAEEERKEIILRERTGMISEYALLHLDDSSVSEPATIAVNSPDDTKPDDTKL